MLQLAHDQRQPLEAWLEQSGHGDLRLSSGQWRTIDCLVRLLVPFKDMTDDASGKTYLTFGLIVPMFNELLDHLSENTAKFEKEASSMHETAANEELRRVHVALVPRLREAATFITGYYGHGGDIMFLGTWLDPRFHRGYFEDTYRGEEGDLHPEDVQRIILKLLEPYEADYLRALKRQQQAAEAESHLLPKGGFDFATAAAPPAPTAAATTSAPRPPAPADNVNAPLVTDTAHATDVSDVDLASADGDAAANAEQPAESAAAAALQPATSAASGREPAVSVAEATLNMMLGLEPTAADKTAAANVAPTRVSERIRARRQAEAAAATLDNPEDPAIEPSADPGERSVHAHRTTVQECRHHTVLVRQSPDSLILYMAAMDFLTVQATSASCERSFSRARHTTTDFRRAMTSNTMRRIQLLKNWLNVPELHNIV